MAKIKRKCHLCQKEYEYCPHCDNHPIWMVTFHDANCKHIFEIVSDYNGKVISPAQAYEMISQCDLSRRNYWSNTFQKYVDAILSYKKVIEPEIQTVNTDYKKSDIQGDVWTGSTSKKQKNTEKKAVAFKKNNSEL